MKRNIAGLLCSILLGLLIGILSIYIVFFKVLSPEDVTAFLQSDSPNVMERSVASPEETTRADYIELSLQIAEYIKNGDYGSLSSLVHPVYGVVFTPYSTVNLSSDLCFSPGEVAAFASDENTYVWGIADGTGDPLEMTVSSYFSQFVFDKDYTLAPVIGVNQILYTGNSLENVTEIFPDAQFVDLSYPSSSAETPDWSTLRLVFEDYEGAPKLVGIIHCQWTV